VRPDASSPSRVTLPDILNGWLNATLAAYEDVRDARAAHREGVVVPAIARVVEGGTEGVAAALPPAATPVPRALGARAPTLAAGAFVAVDADS
jgi:hypothetical protein